MFSGAQLLQVGQALGTLQRRVPLFGARQEYRDRQLGFDIHLHIAAVSARVIRLSGVVVSGVQPHILWIAELPVENSLCLLAKRWSSKSAGQQKCQKGGHFGVSHSNSIGTPTFLARKTFVKNVSPGSILTDGTVQARLAGRPKRASPVPCGRPFPTLTAHAHHCSISFVALILHGLLRCCSNRLFVCVLRQTAVAPNDFLSIYNANQPLGLTCVPGNFHLIRTHICLLPRFRAGFWMRNHVPWTPTHPR